MLRLLGFLLLIACLVLGLGYWGGWVAVRASDSPEGSGLTISLNGDKMRADANALVHKLRTLSTKVALRVKERGQIQGDTTILRGTVAHADPSTLAVRMNDGEVIELPTGTEVTVTLGGVATPLQDLMAGDLITVRLMPQDGGLAVRKVLATRE